MNKSNSSFDKKLGKSFNGKNSQTNLPKKIEPLTRGFFSELIKLETDFYNKLYTAETLDQLIQYYAKAVEFYDTTKDEISSYFIFKIQDALATKKSLKILIEKNTQINETKSNILSQSLNLTDNRPQSEPKASLEDIDVKDITIKENIEGEGSDDEDDVAVKEFAMKRKALYAQKNKDKKTVVSFSTMKNQKQRFVNFYHKLENQKSETSSSMNNLINKFDGLTQQNDVTVQSSISNQKDKIRAKIEEKSNLSTKLENNLLENRSYIAKTLSSNSYFMNNKTVSNINDASEKKSNCENSIFEDVLKDLEDVEIAPNQPIMMSENFVKESENNMSKQKSAPEFFEGIPPVNKLSLITNKNQESRIASSINEGLDLSPIRASSDAKSIKQFAYSAENIVSKTLQAVTQEAKDDIAKSDTSPSSDEN